MHADSYDIVCNSGFTVLQEKVTHETTYGLTSKEYQEKVFKWKHHFYGVVRQLHRAYPSTALPVGFDPMVQYLSGFKVEMHKFNPIKENVEFEGLNHIKGGDVHIFYSTLVPPERQRFTAAHEFAHVLQRLDPEFRADMDAVEDDVEREKIIESVANYIASFYLAPPEVVDALLEGECKLGDAEQSRACVAQKLWVSQEMAKVFLKNYPIIKRQAKPHQVMAYHEMV